MERYEMQEQWKDIKDYEGMYQVSNMGRVRSLDRVVEMSNGSEKLIRGQMLTVTTDQYGYCKVHLSKDNKKKMHRVHRLVAEHFIENPNEYAFVNRHNKDLKNNRADNLYWEDKGISLGNAGKIGGKVSKKKGA